MLVGSPGSAACPEATSVRGPVNRITRSFTGPLPWGAVIVGLSACALPAPSTR